MPIDPNIGRVPEVSVADLGARGPNAPSADPKRFEALLEALDRMRIDGTEPTSVDTLDKAVAHAANAHEIAMDLKRSIEAAFRRAMQE